jgi:centrosomal protein CEP104
MSHINRRLYSVPSVHSSRNIFSLSTYILIFHIFSFSLLSLLLSLCISVSVCRCLSMTPIIFYMPHILSPGMFLCLCLSLFLIFLYLFSSLCHLLNGFFTFCLFFYLSPLCLFQHFSSFCLSVTILFSPFSHFPFSPKSTPTLYLSLCLSVSLSLCLSVSLSLCLSVSLSLCLSVSLSLFLSLLYV